MPLLVVPLAPDDVALLTLAEWDALVARERVSFERPGHPLIERLRAAGVRAEVLPDDPGAHDPAAADERAPAPHADDDGAALVADPASERILELARAGAEVTAGVVRPPDALTAAHAAASVRRAAASLGRVAAVMARLRSVDGCPWDREQTHRSLVVHLLEEAHEVVDAIEGDATDAELREELGDLLLQVAFHARLAEQRGSFDLADVADGIAAKLLHRHPHVFGDVEVGGAAEVLRNWEAIKAAERRGDDAFEGIPSSLPALLAAAKTQKRAARLGFDGAEPTARRRVADALEADDVGGALFWLVALARARGIDAESELRAATRRFREAPG